MFAGGAAVLIASASAAVTGRMDESRYQRLRRDLARVHPLVGLEILIIADIVRTDSRQRDA